MGLNKKSVDDINVKGQKVLVRCRLNVPLKESRVRTNPSGCLSYNQETGC